jgi:septum formation protein
MNLNRPLILASKSPRRKQILENAGFSFIVKEKEIEEIYPLDLPIQDIPTYLSELKANAFKDELKNEIVLTADTIVRIENQALGKPKTQEEAIEMLHLLSGKKHEVITGITLVSKENKTTLSDVTEVYFKKLTSIEIDYYVHIFKPLDKAGAYGIQEWIGYIGIKKIVGSYWNVMGLPIHKVYQLLEKYFV